MGCRKTTASKCSCALITSEPWSASRSLNSFAGSTDNNANTLLNQALRLWNINRFVLLDAEPPPDPMLPHVEGVCSPGVSKAAKAMRSFPPIPAACVAASWFPKNWLSASRSERRRVTDRIQSLYFRKSVPIFDFPIGRRDNRDSPVRRGSGRAHDLARYRN